MTFPFDVATNGLPLGLKADSNTAGPQELKSQSESGAVRTDLGGINLALGSGLHGKDLAWILVVVFLALVVSAILYKKVLK